MRRRRAGARSTSSQLTDEQGQPITFVTPGAPTVDERRRYALAVQRATTPPPLTPAQQAAAVERVHREQAFREQLVRDWVASQQRLSISAP